MAHDKYVRFDWAAKKTLRDKSNFCILEGLVTVLLNEPVHIIELLESESNQEDPTDKFNRVDIKAKNSKDEIILVEIQLTRELYYLERILYGVAKAITEHIQLGNKYDQVKKVYSISIVFDLVTSVWAAIMAKGVRERSRYAISILKRECAIVCASK